jgi:hypothetical protein
MAVKMECNPSKMIILFYPACCIMAENKKVDAITGFEFFGIKPN